MLAPVGSILLRLFMKKLLAKSDTDESFLHVISIVERQQMTDKAFDIVAAPATTVAAPTHACEATLDLVMDGHYHLVPKFANELLSYFQEDIHKDKVEFCQSVGEKASRLMYRAKQLGDEKETRVQAERQSPAMTSLSLIASGYMMAVDATRSVGAAFIAQHFCGAFAYNLSTVFVIVVYACKRDATAVAWEIGLWILTLWCLERSKRKAE